MFDMFLLARREYSCEKDDMIQRISLFCFCDSALLRI